MSQARRIATYADIEALPRHVTGQIVAGQLYAHPRPRSLHARASSNILRQTGPFDDDTHGPDDPGGWVILMEPELHLDADVLVPDIAGWRLERATWSDDCAFISIAPDWVCEVLSPSSEVLDRSEKMPAYAHHGVKHAWLVDPDAKLLEVYELSAGVLRQVGPVFREGSRVVAAPFEAIAIELRRVWG
jgi:Uma2 family endonuclease